MSEIYNNLEKLWKSKGMDRKTFCDKSGIHQSRLSELKKGTKRRLNADELVKVANALDMSLDDVAPINSPRYAMMNALDNLQQDLQEQAEKEESVTLVKSVVGSNPTPSTDNNRSQKRIELFDLSEDAPMELLDSLLTVLRLNKRKTDEKTS